MKGGFLCTYKMYTISQFHSLGEFVMNEIQIVERFTTYLKEKGVEFTRDGFPIFKPEWIVTNKPTVVAPFNKRQYYKENKRDISINFFSQDEYLYPRLERVFEEIQLFKEYHSVCMMDISISPLMLDEVQRMNLLLNMLYICVLAVNGIKIIPSFRTGDFDTLQLLMRSVGYSKYWIMGAVGTQRNRKNAFYDYLFMAKCLLIMPEHLLIYGKPNDSTILCLENYGIEHTQYKDFRTLSYKGEAFYGRF